MDERNNFFWEDKQLGDNLLSSLFPCIFLSSLMTNHLVAVVFFVLTYALSFVEVTTCFVHGKTSSFFLCLGSFAVILGEDIFVLGTDDHPT